MNRDELIEAIKALDEDEDFDFLIGLLTITRDSFRRREEAEKAKIDAKPNCPEIPDSSTAALAPLSDSSGGGTNVKGSQ